MFEKFAQPARQAVVLASEAAKELGLDLVGPEHLLLGLAREGSLAAQVLASLSLTSDVIGGQIGTAAGQGRQPPAGPPSFTSSARLVLQTAFRESLLLGHSYVDTEHLLLGVIAAGDGRAAQIIANSGHTLGQVRERLMQALAGQPAEQGRQSPRLASDAGESPEEHALFAQALRAAMSTPDIASVADNFTGTEIDDFVAQRRSRIWAQASQERNRLHRTAAELKAISGVALPPAEGAARRAHPDLVDLSEAAARREGELAGMAAAGGSLAQSLRQARDRDLTEDEERRADQVVAEMSEAIRSGGSWLEQVRGARRAPGADIPGPGGPGVAAEHARPARRVLDRLRVLLHSEARNSAARYQEVSELLLSIGQLRSAAGTEHKRAGLQLSHAASRLARQDVNFLAATTRAEEAEAALVSALRTAMLPEIRVYIGEHC